MENKGEPSAFSYISLIMQERDGEVNFQKCLDIPRIDK